MEADTVHGVIERNRKKMKAMSIVTPRDWQQLIRYCSSLYNVHNMELRDFKDFKFLYSKDAPFVYGKFDVHKEPVLLSESVHLQVRL